MEEKNDRSKIKKIENGAREKGVGFWPMERRRKGDGRQRERGGVQRGKKKNTIEERRKKKISKKKKNAPATER